MSNSANIAADRIRFSSTLGDVTAAAPTNPAGGRHRPSRILCRPGALTLPTTGPWPSAAAEKLLAPRRPFWWAGPKESAAFNVRNLGDQMRAPMARSQRLFTTFATVCRSTIQCDFQR
jgi:hypothetical protein